MGIRNRTSLGTLREQRKSAEKDANQGEAKKPKSPVASVRSRAFFPKVQLDPDNLSPASPDKSEGLIDRLRQVLQSEKSKSDSEVSDYRTLQDELSRIAKHQEQQRIEAAKDLIDLELPKKKSPPSLLPFRYIVIDGGKSTDDFPLIPKLDRAPSSLDFYIPHVDVERAVRPQPLTLLVNPRDAGPDAEKISPKASEDPSSAAAQFTQSTVTYPLEAKKGSMLPKSLVLSLLDDK